MRHSTTSSPSSVNAGVRKGLTPGSLLLVLGAVWLLFGAGGAGAASRRAELSYRGEIAFLKAVPPRATLAQVRALLPQGARVKMLAPEAGPSEGASGTPVELSGTLSGRLLFLTPAQRKEFDRPERRAAIMRYQNSDPLDAAALVLKRGAGPERDADARRLRSLSAILGRPNSRKWEDPEKTDHISGWEAVWRLPGSRVVRYYGSWDGEPALALAFGYSYNQ